MTTYLSPAASLARAHIAPDSPDLPVGPASWADRHNRVWVECPDPWFVRMRNEHTGRLLAMAWPASLIRSAYGPLMDVTPEWGASDAVAA